MFSLRATSAILCAAFAWPVAANETGAASDRTAPLYRLLDTPAIWALRWGPTPTSFRLEATTTVLPGHELRLARSSALLSGNLARFNSEGATDPLRATWRYTVMARRDWAWKVGLSADMGDSIDAPRAPGWTSVSDRRYGVPALLHMAGEARLARYWSVAVDADALMTARRRAFDLGLRVDYSLSPRLSVYGGYRLSDTSLDNEDAAFAPPLTNSAGVGMRFRF